MKRLRKCDVLAVVVGDGGVDRVCVGSEGYVGREGFNCPRIRAVGCAHCKRCARGERVASARRARGVRVVCAWRVAGAWRRSCSVPHNGDSAVPL